MSAYQGIGNDKFRELLSLVNLYLEQETNVDVEEIQEKIYKAHQEDGISPTQYDYLIGIIE